MRNMIIVTEDNFSSILERLQKSCNRYKMIRFCRVFTEDMKEEKHYRINGIGFRITVKSYTDKRGDCHHKLVRKFFCDSKYIRVTKHRFRKEFEQGIINPSYSRFKCLIHLDLSAGSAISISEGDKIQFLPLGGFIIWTDNNFARYKQIFIPDYFKGKILDLESENTIRDIEWDNDLWDELE